MRARATLVFAAFVGFAACDTTDPPVPTSIRVTPASVTFQSLGEAQAVTAEVLDAAGNPIAGTFVYTWTTSDAAVASVSAAGSIAAVGAGATEVEAAAEGLTGSATVTVDQVPSELQIASGDAQTGEAGGPLPNDLVVVVFDAGGSPAPGKNVTFTVVSGGGSVASNTVTSDAAGRAAVAWTLGAVGTPQAVRASIAGLQQDFSATAQVGVLAIQTASLPNGRLTLPYDQSLSAKGGDGSYTWSIASGSLPSGLALNANGSIQGVPTQAAAGSPLSVRVEDGTGATVTRSVALNVCEAPVQIGLGQVVEDAAGLTGGCGFFLASGGAGTAYRVGMVRLSESESGSTIATSLQMQTFGGVAASAAAPPIARAASERLFSGADRLNWPADRLLADVRLAERTEAAHVAIRDAEAGLVARLGRSALAPNRAATGDRAHTAAFQRVDPPDTITYQVPTNFGSCSGGSDNPSTLLAFNDHLQIYQQTAQLDGADSVTTALAQQMLDYYAAYGASTISEYFGGTSDLNGDGRITVLVTPDVGDGTAAFVWSGDFFQNQATGSGLPPVCESSNAQEIIYFSADVINAMADGGSFQALATVVHEAKHVSSLYNRIQSTSSGSPFHPSWIEEGTAEIAGEIASRKSWAANGGPPVGAEVKGEDFSGITADNYGIFLRLARVVFYMSAQPNGVSASLTSQQGGIYGSGLLFHRFIGDAYGNAASPLADQSLFRTQNDSSTSAGPAAFPGLTGKTYRDLLEEYARALLMHGTGFEGTPRFTTYDLVSATEIFTLPDPPGTFPWPDTRTCNGVACPSDIDSRDSSPPDNDDRNVQMWASFQDTTYMAPLGPGGYRVFEFESNGTGAGAEVLISGAPASETVRVFVTRIR